MKKILYLSYYFEPDLCAGSFRNTSLVKELAKQVEGDAELVLLTTKPNRYSTFKTEAKSIELNGNLKIHRIELPAHESGFVDQIKSFSKYFLEVKRITKTDKYDLVIASSSRLFTAYLGFIISKRNKTPLYLDIRDIFVDTLKDVLRNPILRLGTLFVIKYIEKITFSNANHINLISEGFNDYFQKYKRPKYSNFTNGIDDAFLSVQASPEVKANQFKITYAGNIGEGQGLHIIIPKAAKLLRGKYSFQIIGDGGAKQKLLDAIEDEGVSNVKIINPVKREELIEIYSKSHFLFMHLNDFDAFKKVLPSKVFELGAYPQPLIAGVGGYANSFVKENLSNYILFEPGDVESFVNQITNYEYCLSEREDFKFKYKRKNINKELASSMLSYL
jgi:hypothetical protein